MSKMDRPEHRGIRHLALSVRDLDAMKRFYVNLLGYHVEWEPDADNVYLSSGTDNLALHRSRSASSEAVAALHHSWMPLDHLGLVVKAADDVDRWAAFLEEHGVRLDAKPTTHRDGARSCYLSDPDGNRIQIIHHPPISGKA
jgi:catechol 2,3-dioxygenase-like lactoylglutathione lyase family enzyme